MTHTQKKKFLKDHINRIRGNILAKANTLPDRWDGLELKQYVADHFQGNLNHWLKGKQQREYRNDCLVNNLI